MSRTHQWKKVVPVMGLLAALLIAVLAGCAGSDGVPTPVDPAEVPATTPAASAVGAGDLIVAEAVIEPSAWRDLQFAISGIVAEVLVEPGDPVRAGDVLARLDSQDAELTVAQAEVTLAEAQAQFALLESGARPEEIAVVEAELEAARARVAEAMALQDQVTSGVTAADIASAEAALAQARAEQLIARQQHDQTMECYEIQHPDGRTEEFCPALGTLEEQARYGLNAANEAVAAAEAQLVALQGGSDARLRAASASVWATVAQRNVVEAQLALLQADATDAQLQVAQVSIQKAEVGVELARAALRQYEIRATIDGTVTGMNLQVGSQVSPNQVACTVATLNDLRARTTDLTELSVARVVPGQSVEVVVDAFADTVLEGYVVRVGLEPEIVQGDVTYPTYVAFDEEISVALRWGMQAVVRIVVP